MAIRANLDQRLAALDAALAKGIGDADAGRVKAAEEVLDRLEAKYQGIGRDQALRRQYRHDLPASRTRICRASIVLTPSKPCRMVRARM
ncbi:hypothetical protein [Mesorhizobium ventifaucium]|uniref:Uncharacterized protein n=1 Tax=Mesorhizobium ventifaucium TaxID=666020 RepID=A0ABN8JGV0_9HYPH|nr:hypothetical protein [Mesorhizobium ventifaucium]CAH2396751.1 hypothetical protein MES4922_170141 [Mesorhizobium ventifaucium]